MKKTILVQSFILFLFHLHVVEARDVMKLWANQTKPYYKQNSLVEIESIVWGTPCAANVTEPTLTIYRARGRNTGFGVVIIPGGNYSVVAIHHEGYEVAEIMAKQGVTVAVLKYRLPNPKSSDEPGLVPLADARKALKILRQQSGKYGIDTKKVGVVGFSAGSHLATVASLWKSEDAAENPDFSGLIYGVTNHSEENMKWLEDCLYFRKLTTEEASKNRLLDLVDMNTPRAFLVHAYDDDTCKVEESTLYAQRLFENKIPVEMHLFSKGGHGFGVGRKADGTHQWVPLFVAWLLRQD